MNDAHIESLLRKAPRPTAPSGLKQRLIAEIRLPSSRSESQDTSPSTPFWFRWTPALSFGVFFLGCLIVLGIQTSQWLDLRRENEGLQAATSELEQLRQDAVELERLRLAQGDAEKRSREIEEVQKLKNEVAVLRNQLGEFPALQAEHQRLVAEHRVLPVQAGAAPTNDPFRKTIEKAHLTQCVNNLKQIGLAARMWANDRRTNALPLEWLAMKKELPTPKVLTCPGDTTRTSAISWEQFDGSSVSYELPSKTPNENEPYIVYSRCPIHGTIGLSDGSVMSKFDSTRLQRVDGNLTLQNNAATRPAP